MGLPVRNFYMDGNLIKATGGPTSTRAFINSLNGCKVIQVDFNFINL
jgi:hypothetical protein